MKNQPSLAFGCCLVLSLILTPFSVQAQNYDTTNPALYSLQKLGRSVTQKISGLWDSPEAFNRVTRWQPQATNQTIKKSTPTIQGVKSKTSSSVYIQADNLNFGFKLDPGFSKTSDNLMTKSGSMIVESKDTKIKIQATPTMCENGEAAFLQCYTHLWETKQASFKAQYQNPITLDNQNLLWYNNRLSTQSQTQNNTGRLLLLQNTNGRAAQFLFFEPEQSHLWEMTIEGPSDGILQSIGTVQKVLLSLFSEAEVANTTRQQGRIYEGQASTNTSTRNRSTKGVVAYTNNDQVLIGAENIAFQIEVPKDFSLTQDSLSYKEGSMLLESPEASIELTPTTYVCDSQTQKLINKCILTAVKALADALKKEDPDLWLLEATNYFFQLTHEADSAEDFASLHLFRKADNRTAVGAFREPNTNTVWNITIRTPENSKALLNSNQKIKATLGSMKFKLDEPLNH